jgi:peptidoglycan/LPS O-acetylase OafA/YrhL
MNALSPARHTPYLPALTGVRALAAFWVLLYHLHPALHDFFGYGGPLMSVINSGFQGVDLFFVLSGFIIAHHYAHVLRPFDGRAYGRYLWARVARIYPLHIVMLITVLAMVKLAPLFGFTINRGTDYEWDTFIKNIFLVQAWEFPARLNWNHFAWSISAEWFAYVLAPLFVAVVWGADGRMAQMLVMLLFLVLAPTAFVLLNDPSPNAYALFRIVGAFGAGMVAYRLFAERVGATWNWAVGAWVGLGCVVVLAALQDHAAEYVNFIVVPGAVLFIFALAHQQGRVAAILCNRFFDYAGRVSFSLYMTQFVLLMPLRKILPYQNFLESPTWVQWAYLVGIMTACIGVACVFYHAVEEPARHALRRWVK